MTPDDLRKVMIFLEKRVSLVTPEQRKLVFDVPSLDDFAAAGLEVTGCARLLAMPWWDEMVEEVLETADFCEDDETPDQVLRFARDVVVEYIRKRFPLE